MSKSLPFERVAVLGVPVDVITERDALDFVAERVRSRRVSHIVTVNAEFVVKAQSHGPFLDTLRSAELATPDGAGILWALRRQGIQLKRRVGGSDLIWTVSEQAAQLGHSVFLLGAAPGVASVTGQKLRECYPGLQVAGTHSGSPDPADETRIVDLIRIARADILFVAFGAPEQDLWISRNIAATGVAVAIGVGGSFDYVAGAARRAPGWMRDHGLEWLWRLVRQPSRWRRMLALPQFVWLVLTRSHGTP